MKISYYAETDSLYLELRPGPGVDTREVADGLNVDLDEAGQVLGFDIDHASTRLDLSAAKQFMPGLGEFAPSPQLKSSSNHHGPARPYDMHTSRPAIPVMARFMRAIHALGGQELRRLARGRAETNAGFSRRGRRGWPGQAGP